VFGHAAAIKAAAVIGDGAVLFGNSAGEIYRCISAGESQKVGG